MPWVRFTADFAFVPSKKQQIAIAYKKGMVLLVTTECYATAAFKGAAVMTEKPKGQKMQESP